MKLSVSGEPNCGRKSNKIMYVHDATDGRSALVPSARAGDVKLAATSKDPGLCSLVMDFFVECEKANMAAKEIDKRARTTDNKSAFEATWGGEFAERRQRRAVPIMHPAYTSVVRTSVPNPPEPPPDPKRVRVSADPSSKQRGSGATLKPAEAARLFALCSGGNACQCGAAQGMCPALSLRKCLHCGKVGKRACRRAACVEAGRVGGAQRGEVSSATHPTRAHS